MSYIKDLFSREKREMNMFRSREKREIKIFLNDFDSSSFGRKWIDYHYQIKLNKINKGEISIKNGVKFISSGGKLSKEEPRFHEEAGLQVLGQIRSLMCEADKVIINERDGSHGKIVDYFCDTLHKSITLRIFQEKNFFWFVFSFRDTSSQTSYLPKVRSMGEEEEYLFFADRFLKGRHILNYIEQGIRDCLKMDKGHTEILPYVKKKEIFIKETDNLVSLSYPLKIRMELHEKYPFVEYKIFKNTSLNDVLEIVKKKKLIK